MRSFNSNFGRNPRNSASRTNRRRGLARRTRFLSSERLEPRTVFAVGDLDVTFGGDGIVQTEFFQSSQSTSERISDIAVQGDGKIVAIGGSFITRFNADGSLDTSVGFRGRVQLPSAVSGGNAVAVQSDGKILVASGYGFTIARLNSDFTLDTSFDSDGIAQVVGTIGQLTSLAIQPDGKIVAAGNAYISGGDLEEARYTFAVVRFNQNGSPDTDFDNDGKVTTLIGSRSAYANDVVVQSNGDIVLVGYAYTDPNTQNWSHAAIARYHSDGALDDGFGSGGVATVMFSNQDFATSVVLDEDENIVVGGYDANGRLSIARLLPDGTPDNSFSDDGKLTNTSIENAEHARVAIQADGAIVAVATDYTSTADMVALRYAPDGALDETYGGDGVAEVHFTSNDYATAAALQADGKLVLAGYANISNFSNASDFAVARLDANGVLDPSFGNAGKTVVNLGFSGDNSKFSAVQSDGKVVTAGLTQGNSHDQVPAVTRHLPNGDLDPTFNGDGVVLLTSATNNSANVLGVEVLPDGKILVAGYGYNQSGYFTYIARLLADGSLDASFGTQGIQRTAIVSEAPRSAAITSDGRVVFGGTSQAYSNDFSVVYQELFAARFDADGTPDTTFGGDGFMSFVVAEFDPNQGGIAFDISTVEVQVDGKILLGGRKSNASARLEFMVARVTADGQMDSSFGGSGIVTTSFGATYSSVVGDLVVQPDGNILAVGVANANTSNPFVRGDDMAVVRYHADGTLDPLFNFTGRALVDFGSSPFAESNEFANAVVLSPDGKITLLGQSQNSLAAARLNFDGSTDLSFSGDGKLRFNNYYFRLALDGAILDDGKLLITVDGSSQNNGTDDFTLIRLLGPEPNQTPTADSQNVVVTEDVAQSITLTGSDPDNDSLTYTLISYPVHGVLSGSGANLVYTPNLNYSGGDSFIFKADDGHGGVTASTVTINVNAVNDRPVNVLQSLTAETVDENSFRVFSADEGNRITVSDVDAAGADVQLTLSVTHGTLTLPTVAGLSFSFAPDANGSPAGDGTADQRLVFRGTLAAINTALNGLTYTPAASYDGPDVLAIRLNDLGNTGSGGAKSDLDSINLNVIDNGDPAPNTPPTFTMRGADIVLEDAALQEIFGWATANAGPANEPQSVQYVIDDNSAPSLFSMLPEVTPDGTLRYQPAANQSGEAVITLHVNDFESDSPTQRFTIKIFPVNDRPVVTQNVYNLNEDQVLTISAANGVLNNDTDVDGDPLEAFLVTPPRNGSVILDENGSFTYTPRANWFGTDYFKYRATDPTGASGVGMAIFTIASGGNDDAPVLKSIGRKTVNETAFLTFTASAYDPDGSPLTFSLGGTIPAGASITEGGVFTWTPTDAQGPGTYQFDVRVGDGEHVTSETITVTVAGDGVTNTPPVLTPIGSKNVQELSLLTFTATATDGQTPANALTFSLGGAVPSGASITPAGAFTWTPTAAQGPGVYTFQVLVSDGALTASETISVTVGSIPPQVYEGESPVMGHQTGQAAPDGWAASVGTNAAGFMVYGPYTTAPAAGVNVATFQLMTSDVPSDTVIATIDVYDATSGQTLASTTLQRQSFIASMWNQSFSLYFRAIAGHQYEYRTFWPGNSDVKVDRVVVAASDAALYQAESPLTAHSTGQADGDGWSANPANFSAGILASSNVSGLSVGPHTATYRLLIDNNTLNNDAVAVVDVFDVTLGRVVAARTIPRNAFGSANEYKEFDLAFEAVFGHQYRLRTHWLDTAYVRQDYALLR